MKILLALQSLPALKARPLGQAFQAGWQQVASDVFDQITYSFQAADLSEYYADYYQHQFPKRRVVILASHPAEAGRQLLKLLQELRQIREATVTQLTGEGETGQLPDGAQAVDLILPALEFNVFSNGLQTSYLLPGQADRPVSEQNLRDLEHGIETLLETLGAGQLERGLRRLAEIYRDSRVRIYSASAPPWLLAEGVNSTLARHSPEVAQKIQTTWTRILRQAAGLIETSSAQVGGPTGSLTLSPLAPVESSSSTQAANLYGLGSQPWSSGGAGLGTFCQVFQVPLHPLYELYAGLNWSSYELIIANEQGIYPWSSIGSPLDYLSRKAQSEGIPLLVLGSAVEVSRREIADWGVDGVYQVAESLTAWQEKAVRLARTWSH